MSETVVVDLDTTGWIVDPDTDAPVPHHRLRDHFATHLSPPAHATDVIVYAHGWRTPPAAAIRAARGLHDLTRERVHTAGHLYPNLAESGFEPWTVVVRWPSASRIGTTANRRIRDRAHAMGARDGTGHAAHVLGALLGYLDTERPHPDDAPDLTTRDGHRLHLVGHSFGCRLLCEAVQWAADTRAGDTLGRTAVPYLPSRPFTVDSALLLQMAAPHDAFARLFANLLPTDDHDGAPLRGPIVATHSRHDRAVGFWHTRVEGRPGAGRLGITAAPHDAFATRMLPIDTAYPRAALDHRFVNLDATRIFRRGRHLNPAGAHSDHIRPETAHLLAALADHTR
ncbi:hypothetical protein [Embleya sp. NBC_00896]|uniref:hypothetical protein n=1 Tax=Embleya sp. NBC_00896 TaxID=2975961 RepID=UPI00386A95CB|nr:hypothetical protein OG928_32030 [Embleya sp. NBC_00896]